MKVLHDQKADTINDIIEEKTFIFSDKSKSYVNISGIRDHSQDLIQICIIHKKGNKKADRKSYRLRGDGGI